MARLYLMLLFALLVLIVAGKSAGQYGELAKLSEVRIVVEDLESEEKELGLKEDDIKNHVFVFLRSKLPRLAVKESSPYVYIRVTMRFSRQEGRKIGYFGAVQVMITRQVYIQKNSQATWATVWERLFIINGPLKEAVPAVRDTLDVLLTQFAADWYKDNP